MDWHNLESRTYELDALDLDVINLALRNDVAELKRYVPEVMRLCARLNMREPPWLEDADVADRVTANRRSWPKRAY